MRKVAGDIALYSFWWRGRMLWGSLALLTILFVIGAGAQEAARPAVAPPDPEFVRYMTDRKMGIIPQSTEDGHSLGGIPMPLDLSHNLRLAPSLTAERHIPPFYDLRPLGRVSPVKDQGNCGSCWAFASMAAAESILMPGETRDFSENNLKNTHWFDWGPCEGGGVSFSAAYFNRWSGPVDESDDPYQPDVLPSPAGLRVRRHGEHTYFIFPGSGPLDNLSVKEGIMTYGALATGMNWEDACWNQGTNSFFYGGSKTSNHVVALVGWDDDFDRSKFRSRPPGNGAWIVKNSWGTGWGESGYFYASYYDTLIGRVGVAFLTRDSDNYDAIYQYDPLGWVTGMGLSGETGWGANIFTATSDQTLMAVAFDAASDGSEYRVDIFTGVGEGPVSGTPVSSVSGSIKFTGHHTVKLSEPVRLVDGERFSVVLKIKTPGISFPIPIEYPLSDFSSRATANPGESFVSENGISWRDLTSCSDLDPGLANSNVCIKAYAYSSVCALSLLAGAPRAAVGGASVPFAAWATARICPETVSYDWDFGDGSPHSDSQNPTHAYDSPGMYDWAVTMSAGTVSISRGGKIAISQGPEITSVKKLASPFRLRIGGSGFQPGAAVYIGGGSTPWATLFKSSGLLVLKGPSLKACFPRGQRVEFRVVNPDGGAAIGSYTRP